MLVISSGEFRGNQKAYFERVDKGEEIIVQRGKNRSYKIVPVENDDTLMTKEEFFAMLDEARAEPGGIVLKTQADMDAFFNSL